MVLAGLAALRVGAGHVQLAVAASVAPALAATFPEAGVIALPQDDQGTVMGTAAADACAEALSGADAVMVGPGLDDAEETAALLRRLLPTLGPRKSLVLDAYALGVLPGLDDDAVAGLPAVLTPNAEELRRLLGRDCDPEAQDVLAAAEQYGCCVTAQTVIASPDAHVWRVPLATRGWRRQAVAMCWRGWSQACSPVRPPPTKPPVGPHTCTVSLASGSPRRWGE